MRFVQFLFFRHALVGDHGEELELWCTDKDDEKKFLKMFNEHPEMI